MYIMRDPTGCFFFNDTNTTEIYTLSLHDALPILRQIFATPEGARGEDHGWRPHAEPGDGPGGQREIDEVDSGLYREGHCGRRKADYRRRARHRSRRWLLHPAHGDCRCRSHGDNFAAGNLRPGAGGDQVARLRTWA